MLQRGFGTLLRTSTHRGQVASEQSEHTKVTSKPLISSQAPGSRQCSTLAKLRLKKEKHNLRVKPNPELPYFIFPRERLGLNYDLNAVLNVHHRLTPLGDAFRNLYSRHLLMLSKGKLDAHKALIMESQPASDTQLYYVAPDVNLKFTPSGSTPTVSDATFRKLGRIITDYIGDSENIFVLDATVGSHRLAEHRVRTITNSANVNLYLSHKLPRCAPKDPASFTPELTVYVAPELKVEELKALGLQSNNFAISHPERGILFVVGTHSNQIIKDVIASAVGSRMLQYPIPTLALQSAQVLSSNGKSGLVVDPSNILGQVRVKALDATTTPNSTPVKDTTTGKAKKGAKAEPKKETNQSEAKELFTADLAPNVAGLDGALWNHYGVFRMFQGITHSSEKAPTGHADVIEKIMKGGKLVETQITQHIKDLPSELPSPSSLVFLIRDETSVLPGVAKLDAQKASKFLAAGYTGGQSDSPFFRARPAVGQPGQVESLFQELLSTGNTNVYLCNVKRKDGTELNATEIDAILSAAIDGTLEKSPKSKDSTFGVNVITKVPGVTTSLDATTGWDKKEYATQAKSLLSRLGL